MFSNAILRKVPSTFSNGITTADLGKPDIDQAHHQHEAYAQALKNCGLELTVLEENEDFPDSCFVEDVAVITPEIAIVTRPGATSRREETRSMIPVLEKYRQLDFITAPGTLEGGDVMQAERHFYIGLTQRTNKAGAHQLGKILSQFGYNHSIIPVTGALHLKSVVNYIGNNVLLISGELKNHGAFEGFKIIEVLKEDEYASNCLFVNGKLIMPSGFDRVKRDLVKMEYEITEVDVSEFRKMDGGLSCLSLRF
jgi:dimethylargininase